MEFKVGDHVRVTTKRFSEDQFGKTGFVEETNRGMPLPVLVRFEADYTNTYHHDDLEYFALEVMSSPEFSLDEMALGEEIISQMD